MVGERWGQLHILVNNVGGGGRWGKEQIEETADEVWLDVFRKNALAAALFTSRLLPYMRRAKWGRVVAITSKYGREGGGRPWFTMAKSARDGPDEDAWPCARTWSATASPSTAWRPGTS